MQIMFSFRPLNRFDFLFIQIWVYVTLTRLTNLLVSISALTHVSEETVKVGRNIGPVIPTDE